MQEALEDLMALLDIPGPPGNEQPVAAWIIRRLRELGVPEQAIEHDQAHRQSEYGGEIGNLIVRLEGHGRGARRMFSTHLDTVPLVVGARPRLDLDERRIVNDAPEHALGGDNRTGCAVLLHVARTLAAHGDEHEPVTLVFCVQEEVGLVGSRGLDCTRLGDPWPAMCFNFDGAHPQELVTQVIGTERFTITVHGIAAHAGAAPAEGVSAAVIAAQAIAQLAADGWHGAIVQPDGIGTANVGRIEGGLGSNVVMPKLELLVEARSHAREFRRRIIAQWQAAFQRQAAELTNAAGESGRVEFGPGPYYEPFALADEEPVVREAIEAAQACGIVPRPVSNDGGMDANWLVAHGIPTVTLGAGQRRVHTASEWIDLDDFLDACQLAEHLAAHSFALKATTESQP